MTMTHNSSISFRPSAGWTICADEESGQMVLITRPTDGAPVRITRTVSAGWLSPHGDVIRIWAEDTGDVFPGVLDPESGKIWQAAWADLLGLMTPERPQFRRKREFYPVSYSSGLGLDACWWGEGFWFRGAGAPKWESISVTEYVALRAEMDREECNRLNWA